MKLLTIIILGVAHSCAFALAPEDWVLTKIKQAPNPHAEELGVWRSPDKNFRVQVYKVIPQSKDRLQGYRDFVGGLMQSNFESGIKYVKFEAATFSKCPAFVIYGKAMFRDNAKFQHCLVIASVNAVYLLRIDSSTQSNFDLKGWDFGAPPKNSDEVNSLFKELEEKCNANLATLNKPFDDFEKSEQSR